MRNIVTFLIFSLIAWSVPWKAFATCNPTGPNGPVPMVIYTFPGFSFTEDPNVAVGAVLYSGTITSGSTGGTINCNPDGPILFQGTTGPTLNGVTPPPGGWNTNPGIYPTAVPGIGFKLAVGAIGGPGSFPYYQISHNNNISQTATLTLQFVKTGPITMGGNLTGELAGLFDLGYQFASIQISGSIDIIPKNPACSVATNAINVPLPNQSAGGFNGVGTTAGTPQPFNIQLTCSGGDPGTSSRMYITLTDATNPGNTTDMLSPTVGTANTGVGVRIFNGATPVRYGPDSSTVGNTNQWQVTTVNPGSTTVNIPLTATYVQVGSTVQGGPVQAIATFTMAYN